MMATRFGISPPKAVGTTRSGGDYTVKINTVVGIIRVVYIYIYIYINMKSYSWEDQLKGYAISGQNGKNINGYSLADISF